MTYASVPVERFRKKIRPSPRILDITKIDWSRGLEYKEAIYIPPHIKMRRTKLFAKSLPVFDVRSDRCRDGEARQTLTLPQGLVPEKGRKLLTRSTY